ncbi:MAG: transcriptional regulator [Methanobrevibacter sp.]|jgi:putative transcriptional regulator|nr:transcriptional regulator [Methanobrevibacter sp.]
MVLNDKNKIISEINNLLDEEGFKTSNVYGKSCFDMFARKNFLLLLLKVLVNIDSVNESHVHEIKKISNTFFASPLLVGLKSKNSLLEDGVVYERHGVSAIGLETLKDIIVRGEYPEVLSDRGGYYVQIDGNILKEFRNDYSFSLKELADLVKVSRETIYNYENNLSRANTETTMLLEELLNMKITLDIDVFKPKQFEIKEENFEPNFNSSINSDVNSSINPQKNLKNDFSKDLFHDKTKNLEDLGLGVISTKKTPFDALAKIEGKKLNSSFITSLEENMSERTMQKVAISLKDLSLVTGSQSFFIINDEKFKVSFDGIPVISSWEIKELEDTNEFLKIVKERED